VSKTEVGRVLVFLRISYSTDDPKGQPHALHGARSSPLQTQLFADLTNLPILYWHVCQLGRQKGLCHAWESTKQQVKQLNQEVSSWAVVRGSQGVEAPRRQGCRDSRSSHLSRSISVWCVQQGLWHFIKLRDSESSSLLLTLHSNNWAFNSYFIT